MSYACTHDPVKLSGQPIGMYHCPECGLMVVAGMPHPKIKRYCPRTGVKEPRIDISHRPELWGDEDEYDYDTDENDHHKDQVQLSSGEPHQQLD